MSENKKNIDEILDSVEDVVSMQECTGLVSRGSRDEEEFDNLMHLQQFSPKSIKNKKAVKQSGEGK